MATKSKTVPTPSTMLEAWVDRTRRSWVLIAVAASLVLLLLLFTAAYLDGVLIGPINLDYWRYALMSPAMVAYVLLTHPKLKQLRESAIRAFRPLIPLDDEHFRRTLSKAPLFDRRREWLAVFIGAAAGVLVTRAAWPYYQFWTTLYLIMASAIMFGLLGWLAYTSLAGTRLFPASLVRSPDLNVFDMAMLEPIGRWSLGVALSFVGGITLSLIFLPRPARIAGTATMYAILILAPVLVFFLNMVSTRRVIVHAKKRELRMVRDHLAATSRALREKAADAGQEEMSSLLGIFSAWVAVEQRVKAVPEWPYTATIRRSLAVSLLLPIAVGVGQALLTDTILRSMG
jgi:hypothetical protein